MKEISKQSTAPKKTAGLMALMGIQFWRLKKSPIHYLLLAGFLAAGLYGLYQGFAFKQKQCATIAAFSENQNANVQRMAASLRADTTTAEGREAYIEATELLPSNRYLVLSAVKDPVSTSLFSIGQGDVFPYYYTIKNESFFMQLFKQGEIANPLRSLAGHFDFCFWVIYLLPLLIVMLLFNALSAELDNGNWRLISSQGVSTRQWLLSQVLLVGLLVGILLAGIFAVGILLNQFYFGQPPTAPDLLFFLGAALYLAFWLSIVYCINSFGKSTSSNAFYGGSVWIMACIVMPTLVTMLIEQSIPIDNTVISRMSRRPQGDKFDDDDFGVRTIRQMSALRPEFGRLTINPEDAAFRFAVYMAYHELRDDTNRVAVRRYFGRIERRQQWSNASVLINPAAAMDGIFTGLAANDASASHRFVWRAQALQAGLHEAFYPALFNNRPLREADYRKMPTLQATEPHPVPAYAWLSYVLLLGMTVCLWLFGNYRLRRWEGK